MSTNRKKKKEDGPRRRRSQEIEADWGGIDADKIRAVIAAIAKTGGAARFGYSRDGSSYTVGIYGDGKPFTEFLPGDGDVEGWLEGFAFDYE